jgi:hypothetical protein
MHFVLIYKNRIMNSVETTLKMGAEGIREKNEQGESNSHIM